MAANIITKRTIRHVFYAPSMRNIVNKLQLLSRIMSTMATGSTCCEGLLSASSPNWPHDSNFPLPGNIGVDFNNLDERREDSSVKKHDYRSLASALFQLENESLRKQQIANQFIAEADEMEISTTGSSASHNNKVECKIQICPPTLKKGFKNLFSGVPEVKDDNFVVITISQETVNDMAVWSEEVEEERETLMCAFIEHAKEICEKIKESGYWADFIEPASGKAFHGEHRNETLFETDDRFNQLGFDVEDLGCCKVLLHKQWKSNVFVGVIFTNAPVESHVFAYI